jgi:hypothetical protein
MIHMRKSLVIISHNTEGADEVQLQNFAHWMGLETKMVALQDDADVLAQMPGDPAEYCVAIAAGAAGASLAGAREAVPLLRLLEEQCSAVFVFGFSSSAPAQTIQWPTHGNALKVMAAAGENGRAIAFDFPAEGGKLSAQFAGLSFVEQSYKPPSVFETVRAGKDFDVLLQANQRPAFVSLQVGACRFFLAGTSIPDIEQPVTDDKGDDRSYSRLIPVLLFFRFAFGAACWHGIQKTARIIVDDPLLQDSYGSLRYSRLFEVQAQEDFGTTIAFIPWNHRRTAGEWVSRLQGSAANFSICIHGCDHTNREFSAGDLRTLEQKAGLAITRMERHEQRTHMPFEDVMVFPQGHFSHAAIKALQANRYLAAINTTCIPTDGAPGALRLKDLLRPAVTRFYGFPIFKRQYPKRTIDFAFDLFMGKPAFVVEHHPYFADDCAALETFVRKLRALEPDLAWPSLAAQIVRSCLVREMSEDSLAVKFFTRKFILENKTNRKLRYRLERDDVHDVSAVHIDGKPAPFDQDGAGIRLDLELTAGESREIEVVDAPEPQRTNPKFGMRHSLQVLVRRELSEFRDNTLSQHPGMLRIAKRAAKGLRVTGDKKA